MKKIFALVSLLLAAALLLTACGSSGIEGTWELVEAKIENEGNADFAASLGMVKEMGGSLTFTFKDGTMTMHVSYKGQSETQEAAYEIKDGKLVAQGTVLDMKFDGNKLTLSEGGNSIILERK